MKLRKLILCLFLSVALTVTFIPTMAYAEGGVGTDEDGGRTLEAMDDDDDFDWFPEAVDDEVELVEGKAKLQVVVYAYDEDDERYYDVTESADFVWQKWDGYDEGDNDVYIDLEDAENSPEYDATKAGVYTCAVTYEEDVQSVDFYVTDGDEGETSWEIETNADVDDEVILDEDGEAYLEVTVYAIDDEGELDVTDEATFKWSYYDEDEEGYIDIAETGNFYIASGEGEFRCEVTYNGETDYAYFYTVYDEEEYDWYADADEDEVELVKGKALLEVYVYEYDNDDDEYYIVTDGVEFQWKKAVGYDEVEEEPICELISGATESTYTATEAGTYFCDVTYKGDTESVEFEVFEGLGWYVEAISDEVELVNGEAQLAVRAYTYDANDNEVDITDASYQWEKYVGYDDVEEEEIYEPISGANKATYTATKVGDYRCVVTYNGDSQKEYFEVWKNRDWTITSNADENDGEVFMDKNGIAVLALHVFDKDGIDVTSQAEFKWYYEDPDTDESVKIETATSNTYTATKAGSYWCRVAYDENTTSADFYVRGAFDDIPDNPVTLALNVDKEVQITEPGQVVTLAFTAPADGTYFFESVGSPDTKGCVLDEDGAVVEYNDDYSGADYNFRAYFEAVKGKTYYLQVRLYDTEESGISFVVHAKEGYEWFVITNADLEGMVYLIGDKVALEAHAVIDTGDDLEYLDDATYQWCRHSYDDNDNPVNTPIAGATDPVYQATQEGEYVCIVTYEGNVEKVKIEVEEISEEDLIDDVADLINDLPDLDKIDLSNEWEVEYAQDRFDALTDEQKASISDELKTKLDNAFAKITKLRDDKDAADAVIALIRALPAAEGLTLKYKDAVEEAKARYEALTEDQKALISDTYKALISKAAAKMAGLVYDASVEQASNLTVSGLKVIPKKKKAVVKWKANTEASGYVIQYSMKKNFKKAKVKTIKKADAKKVKIKKLKSKKYFFRIATYTNVTDPVSGNDVVVKGKWSKPKKVKIK